jgi:hypothetical protein
MSRALALACSLPCRGLLLPPQGASFPTSSRSDSPKPDDDDDDRGAVPTSALLSSSGLLAASEALLEEPLGASYSPEDSPPALWPAALLRMGLLCCCARPARALRFGGGVDDGDEEKERAEERAAPSAARWDAVRRRVLVRWALLPSLACTDVHSSRVGCATEEGHMQKFSKESIVINTQPTQNIQDDPEGTSVRQYGTLVWACSASETGVF